MKFKETKEAYYEYSSQASEILRKLAFAEIATIWLFCIISNGTIKIPNQLVLPLALTITGLIADFLQYLIATISWGTFHRINELKKDKKGDRLLNDESEISAPGWINWPHNSMFIIKVILMVCASYLLIKYLASITIF